MEYAIIDCILSGSANKNGLSWKEIKGPFSCCLITITLLSKSLFSDIIVAIAMS